ncbi:MAG: glycosyltransferase family 4 protein [Phycisphaerales bacterium]
MTQPGPANPAPPTDRPIRLCLFQPALPKYRIPVFRELDSRPGIDLNLFYSADEPVKNVTPDGFRGTPIKSKVLLQKPRLLWRQAQIDLVDPTRFDLIMGGWNTRYLSLVPCLLLAKKRGLPTVLWGHGYSKRETTARRLLRDKIGNLATALVFYGATARNRFVERNKNGHRAFVAPNSLDQSEIQAARRPWLENPEKLRAFREKNGLNGPVLLFVSRLSPENRTDLLLKAGGMLARQYKDLRIVIIGGGAEEASLRECAAKEGVAERTTFTGAIYEEAELAPWFASADLFVYPRNIGLSLLHAMGYGLPVVTTDFEPSWAPEVEALQPWINGMTYEDGSADALAHIVGALLSDRDRLDKMKANALRTATGEYSLKKMVDGLETAIRYAAGTRRSA